MAWWKLSGERGEDRRVASAIATGILLIVIAALAVMAAVAALDPNPSQLAVTRTLILSALTVGAAAASRHRRMREAGIMVWPLLVILGLKLLASDFRVGSAAALFGSLAAYGAALIVAPRLRFREVAAEDEEPEMEKADREGPPSEAAARSGATPTA